MVRYLLDTNAISDVIKNPYGSIAAKLHSLPDNQLCTSIIVAAELRYGAVKKSSPTLSLRIEKFLGAVEVLPLTGSADHHYSRIRADLETKGVPIGANDMLIAAHALAANCVLVTDNVREFSRVSGLKIENWRASARSSRHTR